jgi:hypothetical protein
MQRGTEMQTVIKMQKETSLVMGKPMEIMMLRG